MRKICSLSVVLLVFSVQCFSQDSTRKWTFSVSMGIDPVAVTRISGTDTSIVNSLSISPGFSIRHANGLGFSYSPKFVTGGATPGIYMHVFTFGMEQYDKETFDYAFNYNHYFFTNKTGVPYSPLNNDISGSVSYKKNWLKPSLSAGIGFGNNTETNPSTSAYDIGASVGVSHGFSWDTKPVSYSLTPSLTINGGTNQYFSLLSTTKYIGRNKNLTKFVKSSKAAAAAARSANRRAGTTTTTSTTEGESFHFSNIELGLESALETGYFSIRPSISIYLPVGSSAGDGLSAYWGISLGYHF